MEHENFIYKTSREIFEKNYNILIEQFLCENLDNYVHEVGTQKVINEEYVMGSGMCFFIFLQKLESIPSRNLTPPLKRKATRKFTYNI